MGFISKLVFLPFKLLRWLIFWVIAVLLMTVILSTPADALTEYQSKAISQNCSTMQKSLSQLQKVDSRTRSYLGTTYETIANRFIIPLNLRLVKNNRPVLSNIQADFIAEQNNFRTKYTDYMRELEALIVTDCKNQPEEFYRKLTETRIRREELRQSTVKLSDLAEQQYAAVLDLRSQL